MNTQLADELRALVEQAAMPLRALPDPGAHAPGAWSARQTIGHLIDSAANNHQRFVRAQIAGRLVLAGYEQNQWIAVQRYDEAPWPELIELWRLYNLHLARVIAGMPHAALSREHSALTLDEYAGQVLPAAEPVTLEYLVRDYIAHTRGHLAQIFTAL